MVQRSLFEGASFNENEKPQWEIDDESDCLFAEVVFDRPLDDRYLYEIPYPLRDQMAIGKRVKVPFGRGNQQAIGFCVGIVDSRPSMKVKEVSEVIDDVSLLSERMLNLAIWMAREYCCGIGQVLNSMIPGGVKSGAGTREQIYLGLSEDAESHLESMKLSSKQRRVVDVLRSSTDMVQLKELARSAGCTVAPINALRRRGILRDEKRRVLNEAVQEKPVERENPLKLSAAQQRVSSQIKLCLVARDFAGLLLHGVTGSGKTEIYLQAIAQVVQRGQQAIVLVPEISLTPQTIRRFRTRFDKIAVLHSHLTDARRHHEWRRIADGEAEVVIGARSAVFAPTPDLGLIVIDEEHETTFKQETTPRYHARDVAEKRARDLDIPLIMGSATPSLESWVRAQTDRYHLLSLPERVANLTFPTVKLVDMRFSKDAGNPRTPLSRELLFAMKNALDHGGQVILLLNRRGFSTNIMCYKCGFVAKCPRCDISLVYHQATGMIICHSCDLELNPYRVCPDCKDSGLNYRGFGTERLEQQVRRQFSDAVSCRMDTDTMRRPGSHEDVLERFRSGEIRILLGTQMIAKGLDFPGVTLVGVVAADSALHLPDFRASERTFQLVAQVSGRTGRGEDPGRVLVQTFTPGHPAIKAASQHDYIAFADSELPMREIMGYPPFGRMVRIILRSRNEAIVQAQSEKVAEALNHLIPRTPNGSEQSGWRLLGPAPAPVTRLNNYFRFHLQLLTPLDAGIQQLVRDAFSSVPSNSQVENAIDIDPLSML